MSEAEKEQGQEVQAEQAPKKSRGPLLLIIIAVVGFIACIAVFSLIMGVFSSGDQSTSEKTGGQIAASDSTADSKSNQTDISAMEKELFDSRSIADARDMDEIMKIIESSSSGMNEKDSAALANWLSKEKAQLNEKRAELDARQSELDKREYRLNQTMEEINQVQSNRVASLAKLYDGMKAEQVAPLINKLSEEQSVQVLLKMKPANAAKVLGAIEPDRAARISARMLTFAEE